MNLIKVYKYAEYPGYFKLEVIIDDITLVTGYDNFLMTRETVDRVAKKLAKVLNCKVQFADDQWLII